MSRNKNISKKSQLKKGCHVEIHGLQNAVHLNGKKGKLKTFHKDGANAGRWAVRIEGEEKDTAVKPENLKVIQVSTTPQQEQHMSFEEWSRSSGSSGAARGSQAAPNIQWTHLGRAGDPMQQQGSGGGAGAGGNASWANGLSTQDQYEWFSNCYQMRCDDDYVHGGCNLHGPYEPTATPASITTDFMAFCLLAKRAECIPSNWNWTEFLLKAATFVSFAFEKSDAKERWGSENVFQAMMGGRSLRFTAEQAYGSSCQDHNDSPQAKRAEKEAKHPTDEIFNEIGGRHEWESFQRELASSSRFSGGF